MTLENLLVFAAIVVVAFVNVILPWLKKRREGGLPGEPEPAEREDMQEQDSSATALQPMEPLQPTVQPDLRRRSSAPLAAAVRQAVAPRPRRSPVGSLEDARRGIVLRTVLGPCRAQEPFGSSSN
jgi:hypothetical protein